MTEKRGALRHWILMSQKRNVRGMRRSFQRAQNRQKLIFRKTFSIFPTLQTNRTYYDQACSDSHETLQTPA